MCLLVLPTFYGFTVISCSYQRINLIPLSLLLSSSSVVSLGPDSSDLILSPAWGLPFPVTASLPSSRHFPTRSCQLWQLPHRRRQLEVYTAASPTGKSSIPSREIPPIGVLLEWRVSRLSSSSLGCYYLLGEGIPLINTGSTPSSSRPPGRPVASRPSAGRRPSIPGFLPRIRPSPAKTDGVIRLNPKSPLNPEIRTGKSRAI